jgi:hypothetical protein
MIPPNQTSSGDSDAPATIAAMPKELRSILLALFLVAAAAGILGCGGDGGPDPSLSADEAALLTSKINEIQANVDVGSCLVAASKTEDLLADVDALPSSVNQEVKNALVRGATNLKGLLEDPDKCQSRAATTTSTPSTTESTTESTTTTRTQPTTTHAPPTETVPNVTTTPTQTQTTTPPTTGGSGGLGPGGL